MGERFSLLRAKERARADAARRSKGDGRLIRERQTKVYERERGGEIAEGSAKPAAAGQSRLSSDKRCICK